MMAFWEITSAKIPEFSSVENYQGSLRKGEYVFNASGCASCHSSPDTTQEEKLVLIGGRAFPSPFGTFYAPNFSMDKVTHLTDSFFVGPEGKESEIIWNGKNQHGDKIANGVYFCRLSLSGKYYWTKLAVIN